MLTSKTIYALSVGRSVPDKMGITGYSADMGELFRVNQSNPYVNDPQTLYIKKAGSKRWEAIESFPHGIKDIVR